MRLTLVLALGAGVVLAVLLVLAYGFDPIVRALEAVGWGAGLVALVRAIETTGAGIAWRWLLPEGRPLLRACALLRWIRESINALLPVAQVGGEIAGARCLTFFGVDAGTAGASVLVDLLVQTATQLLFTMAGLGVLVWVGGADSIVRWVVLGLAVMAPALGGFFAVQRFGGLGLIERVVARFARDPHWAALGGLSSLNTRLGEIYARRGRLAAAFALHFAIWFVGVFEVLVALRFMGHPVPYQTALVIESLGQAVRGAAFIVPGAIGVQEGGFVALCAVFAIPAPTAVALSLVKRFPEIVLGIPGLLIWQGLEGRRLLASPSVTAPPQPRGKRPETGD